MFADSICSGDVSSIKYPTTTQEFLGLFKMGGLDGFSFEGLTELNYEDLDDLFDTPPIDLRDNGKVKKQLESLFPYF